jgi:hypothetical protein
MTLAYLALLALALILGSLSLWAPAIIAAAGAFALALRFEIRWALDHTPLTSHDPRPVPRRR